jgi:hypothetical protein
MRLLDAFMLEIGNYFLRTEANGCKRTVGCEWMTERLLASSRPVPSSEGKGSSPASWIIALHEFKTWQRFIHGV